MLKKHLLSEKNGGKSRTIPILWLCTAARTPLNIKHKQSSCSRFFWLVKMTFRRYFIPASGLMVHRGCETTGITDSPAWSDRITCPSLVLVGIEERRTKACFSVVYKMHLQSEPDPTHTKSCFIVSAERRSSGTCGLRTWGGRWLCMTDGSVVKRPSGPVEQFCGWPQRPAAQQTYTHTHTTRLYSAPLMMPVCLQYQCEQISTSMSGYLWNVT